MSNKDDERLRKTTIAFLKDFAEQGYENAVECIDWLEKQGEQKSIDMVEPKFHEGDWIITDKNHIWYVDEDCSTTGYLYRLVAINGKVEVAEYEVVDEHARLWTIADAKDGDILFQDLMCGKTFIYNGINPDMAILYSFLISNDGEDVLPYHIGKPNTGIGFIEENKNIIHPATKKQRELLFAKMKEAGYEWDIEKKEVKKIEPKFKVGDYIVYKGYVWKVFNISLEKYYELLKINNEVSTCSIEYVDNNAHLWTIQDAKDGDILVSKSGDKIFSYRGNLDLRGRPCAYYGIYKVHDGIRFSPCAIGNYFTYEDVHPATKEQCEQLEEAMAEAGYTFDFDKKELNKIEAPRL